MNGTFSFGENLRGEIGERVGFRATQRRLLDE